MTPNPTSPHTAAPVVPLGDALAQFMAEATQCMAHGGHLLLANPAATQGDLQRIMVRPVQLKGQAHWSFTYRHATRDVTRNLSPNEGAHTVAQLAGVAFRNLHAFNAEQELQLAYNRKGKASLRRGQVASQSAASRTEPSPSDHNREKQHLLSLGRPFLAALGVADAQGHLVPAMARKWKQINRFVEVLDAALRDSVLADATRPLAVADFGSGKGYLTFAVHDHLSQTRQAPVRVRGVELRHDMVALCNGVVQRLGLQGLVFEEGDVGSVAPQALDVMIALHACDTATDHAIAHGLKAGASIIVCAPCCHKQLRPQLLCPTPLKPLLQHGVHLGQEAEMLTDGLRALLLQAQGYDCQIFEFVSLEHTAKNKMILAVKRGAHKPQAAADALAQVAALKQFYVIREQCLESLLMGVGQPAG